MARPTKGKAKDFKRRYEALELSKKRAVLNEARRRKLAVREALNHHLELDRLQQLARAQRIASLRHIGPRMANLEAMIRKVQAGPY